MARISLAFLLCLSSLVTASSGAGDADAAQPDASIVHLTTATATGNRHACGFVVTDDGLVATNLIHLADADRLTARLPSGETFSQLAVAAVDPARDLVLLKLPTTGLEPLALGDASRLEPGTALTTTCCGVDPMCTTTEVEVAELGVHPIGVRLVRFRDPPFAWESGAPLLAPDGRAVAIANVLRDEGANVGVTANDIAGLIEQRVADPMPIAEFRQLIAARLAEQSAAQPQQQEPQAGPLTLVGTWRVPNRDLVFFFFEEAGIVRGREMLHAGGTVERLFELEPAGDGVWQGVQHLFWGCAYKKSVLHKRHEKTCQLDLPVTATLQGPSYLILEIEELRDGLPEPDDDRFTTICETCANGAPRTTTRYEAVRTQ